MRQICFVAVAGLGLAASAMPAQAMTINLYNGSGSPQSQSLFGGGITENGVPLVGPSFGETPGTGTVNTAANSAAYSGYSNYFPGAPGIPATYSNPNFSTVMNATVGFDLNFRLTLNSATGSNPDRPGLSVTMITSGNQGVELGFYAPGQFASYAAGGVFQQNSDFTDPAGTVANINTNAVTDYSLRVRGSSYQLFANGNSLLSGSLITYSFDPANSQPRLPFNPYTTSNFIFFGDNTSQASSNFTLGAASVTAVPVPPQLLGTAIFAGIAAFKRRSLARQTQASV